MEKHVETCPVLIEEIAEHSVAAGEALGSGIWPEALGSQMQLSRWRRSRTAEWWPSTGRAAGSEPSMAASGVEAWHRKDIVHPRY